MLIDLDHAPPPMETPARPRRPRRYWAAAVAVLVLALAGGAAAPGRDGLTPVLTIDGRGVSASLLTEEALYLVRLDGRAEAHALCAGCPQWSTSVNPGQRLTLAGDALIVDAGEGAVAVLDARTGELRWRTLDSPLAELLGGNLMTWTPEGSDLRVLDLRTGRELWKRPVGSYTSGDSRVVVFDDPSGVTVLDAADGTETVRGDLDLPRLSAQVLGGRLLVFGDDHLAAYRLADLKQEWLAFVSAHGVLDCGGLLCAVGLTGMSALDPADGSVRWSDPRWMIISPDGVASDEDGHSAQLDLATGRLVRDFGRGAPVGDLVLHPERGRTTVTRLTDGRVVGVLPLTLPRACSVAGPYLGCERPDVTITVWQAGS
ncbi:PQQ-binding-like beta-propeller repeat protein [Actinoplanes solisilvae]|uniref:outer membrane protein assembly factor BamB family protein n=1 Tax=Actinoplanes solisilvae TaxID=2486853 RepID=UPI000FD9FE8B|nr:PQQ-binding-like beta-propeller repeat protein [Actinoplanes solisilvae]